MFYYFAQKIKEDYPFAEFSPELLCLDENFLKQYFPKEIPGSEMILEEHKIELRKLGWPVPIRDELQTVFNHVNNKFRNSEHSEVRLLQAAQLKISSALPRMTCLSYTFGRKR